MELLGVLCEIGPIELSAVFINSNLTDGFNTFMKEQFFVHIETAFYYVQS